MLCKFLLYSEVNHTCMIYIHVHHVCISYMYPRFFWISFPFRSPQSIEWSSLYYTAGSHQLSILYILVYIFILYILVYICQSKSPSSSHHLFPPLVSIRLFCTSLSLFLSCKQVHQHIFSRFHIYALIYNICFSLLTYFTLYDSLQIYQRLDE